MTTNPELSPRSGRLVDIVGDRHCLLRLAVAAIFGACVVFAAARLAVTLSWGKPTPWWANAAGAVTVAAAPVRSAREPAPVVDQEPGAA